MAWRIGVDSGGTFTDVCLFDDSTGRVEVWKVPSTPDDASRGIAQGVAEGLEQVGAPASEVGYFGHGTTVATNALIQHKGVRTGLITSDGFRDLLEIGRQKRPELYDLQAGGLLPPEVDPVAVAEDIPRRYERLWSELTSEELRPAPDVAGNSADLLQALVVKGDDVIALLHLGAIVRE